MSHCNIHVDSKAALSNSLYHTLLQLSEIPFAIPSWFYSHIIVVVVVVVIVVVTIIIIIYYDVLGKLVQRAGKKLRVALTCEPHLT